MSSEWKDNIFSPALTTMHQRKYNKVEELPKSEDVKDFADFLQKEINTVIEEMKSKVVEERSSLYRRGHHLALAHLTFFNKRRPGEVEQLQLTTFTNEPDYRKEDIDEIQDTLTSLEKQLCADIQLVFVRGKRGRKVPIIIMPSCFELMESLVETRLEAGIPKKNNYFFGRYNALTPLRACDSLRLLTEEANIENAELIKSTKL